MDERKKKRKKTKTMVRKKTKTQKKRTNTKKMMRGMWTIRRMLRDRNRKLKVREKRENTYN